MASREGPDISRIYEDLSKVLAAALLPDAGLSAHELAVSSAEIASEDSLVGKLAREVLRLEKESSIKVVRTQEEVDRVLAWTKDIHAEGIVSYYAGGVADTLGWLFNDAGKSPDGK